MVALMALNDDVHELATRLLESHTGQGGDTASLRRQMRQSRDNLLGLLREIIES